MYEENYQNGAKQTPKTSRLQKLFRRLSIFVSLALVAFLAYWAFNLGRRDAADVPVVEALLDNPRSKPDDPGGANVDFQGLEVNQVLEGDSNVGEDGAIQLAPDATNLDGVAPAVTGDDEAAEAEDALNLPLEPIVNEENPVEALTEVAEGTAARISPPPTRPQLLFIPPKDQMDPRTAEARPVGTGGQAVAEAEPIPVPGAEEEEVLGVEEIEINQAAPEDATGAPSAPASDIGPRLPSGTPLIQLAAYPDIEDTRQKWQELRASNNDILGDKQLYIETTEVGGTTYYRLRVQGFADGTATRTACSALIARNLECLSVNAK